MIPILKRRKRKLGKMRLLSQYHVFAKNDAWIQTRVDLTSKPGLLLTGTQRGAGGGAAIYASTGLGVMK